MACRQAFKTSKNGMKHIITFITALVLCALPATPQTNVLGLDDGYATTVGIYIKELSTGKVLADHNSYLALTPASVTKTVTSATALMLLGPDFRFATTVGLSGRRSASDRSRWEGDIVIRGGGDPTLGSTEFKSARGFTDSIVAAVKRLGIKSITGYVSVVDNMKDAGQLPSWECEDIAWPYGTGLYGFNYRGNYVRAYPDKGTTSPASTLKIAVRQWSKSSTDQLRGINDNNLTVWAPAQTRRKKDWSINTSNPDPAYSYAAVLADALRAEGIAVGKKAAGGRNPSIDTELYTQRSPAARYILRNLMKRSDNLFAEGMLRALVPDGSRADCITTEQDYWSDNGLNVKSTVILDGSGLSRANRFSPRFLCAILEYMAAGRYADTFVDFFPVAGIDGTLKNFGAKTSLKGRLALKTGSISGVQTYAGYYLDRSGRPTHTVVIMVNGFFCPRAELKGKIEKYLLNIFKK